MKSVSSDTGFAAGTDFNMSENKCYSNINEAGKACNKKVPFIFFVVVLAFFIALLLSIVIVCIVFAMKISFLESETASLRMASTLQQQQVNTSTYSGGPPGPPGPAGPAGQDGAVGQRGPTGIVALNHVCMVHWVQNSLESKIFGIPREITFA